MLLRTLPTCDHQASCLGLPFPAWQMGWEHGTKHTPDSRLGSFLPWPSLAGWLCPWAVRNLSWDYVQADIPPQATVVCYQGRLLFSLIHTAACKESWGAWKGTLWQVAHKIANSVERIVQELPDVQVVWPIHTTEETTLRFSLWVFREKVP